MQLNDRIPVGWSFFEKSRAYYADVSFDAFAWLLVQVIRLT